MLARAGLDAERALPELERAGLVDEDAPDVDVVTDLLRVCSEAADPSSALLTLTSLAAEDREVFDQVRAEGSWLQRVALVGGASGPLGDLLARYPEATDAVRTLDPVRPERVAELVADALARAEGEVEERAAAIAGIRRHTTAHIAARDLTGAAPLDEVAADLAALAEGVLEGTLRVLHERVGGHAPHARLAVIGMGKLGGHELNYVSDVDVVFVHEPLDDEEAAEAEAREVLAELLALLNASTTMGRTYEIDPTLRPEGRSGALSRTVESFVRYWERWAETWEFQALLKARPVAGDMELGERWLRSAAPFVYPDELDPGVIAEIRGMKGRVEAKPEVRRHGDRQVKLGPGGIRDIEFAVQLLQLVHGRSDHALRLTGTLPTLQALAEGGYVAEEDAHQFADAYRTLRTVEHRLQLATERRTHTIPEDQVRQERLARSLGYRPVGDVAAREPFLQDLRAVQADVRGLHAKLFYRPLLESHAAVSVDDADLARTRGLDDAAATERLVALGFGDARSALRDLRSLVGGMTRAARTVRVILPTYLQELSDTPDPDTGLRRFRDLIEAQSGNQALLGRLRDHPPTVTGMARVLGTSEVAGELLLAQPQGIEWFDEAGGAGAPTREELVEQAMARLRWQDPFPALRRFKRHLQLRTVLRDLLGDVPVSTTGRELTAVAEAVLEAGLASVLTDLAIETGDSRPADLPVRMTVIGMGKLGGGELHYVSDLDVMFLHEPVAGQDRSEVHALANRVAERLMRTLGEVTAEGTAFEMDADLRPEGRQGPLSRSLESFRSYYERWSEPWEHQALVRARPVAGDTDLGARFLEFVRPLAYPDTFGPSEASRMRRMKARMEKERIRRRHDPARHLKLGPGGISDVEWTVQFLQQQHGARQVSLRTTNTMSALDAAQDLSLIEHRDAAWMRDGYDFLSLVRNRLYLLRQRNVDVLPTSKDVLTHLARSLGFAGAARQEFDEAYLRHTRHVRRVAERVFYEMDDVAERGSWERG